MLGILTIGSEILDGRVQDTNANYIAAQLSHNGIKLNKILSCDDVESEIVLALNYLASTCRVIICSGGLGPTADDLTREAVAKFCRVSLELDQGSLTTLQARFAERKRVFDPSNKKQAFFPRGSTIIHNTTGTAPGFKISHENVCIYALPGVPPELEAMFNLSVLPEIQSQFSVSRYHAVGFRLFGLPEATVGSTIQSLSLPDQIQVSYRAHFPEIHLVLKSEGSLDSAVNLVTTSLGSYIFSTHLEVGLPEIVRDLFVRNKLTLSVAESCTGGMLAEMLTNCSGSSAYFLGGAVTYSNQLKSQILGVSAQTLLTYGAVSEQVAIEMAAGARKQFGSDIAISITGVAGPEGGTESKPVGTFFIGYASIQGTSAQHYFFSSKRDFIRRYAAYCALRKLQLATLAA